MSFEYTTPAIAKWKLDDFMGIIDRFEDELAAKTHHRMHIGNDYPTILLHIVGKSILTTREILTLCAHGYPDGSLSLGRNLYEQMMIVAFFETHKNDSYFQEYVDDFFLSYDVQRNKCLRDIKKYIPKDSDENLDQEHENLKRRTARKLKGDYWWAGCNTFSDLVGHIMKEQNDDMMYQFLGIHYARYKRACVSLHSSCMGNSNRMGKHSGFEVIDTSPTMFGHSSSLIFTIVSLISIIGFACENFQIDGEQYLKPLNDLAIYYQSEEKEDFEKSV